MWVISRAPPPWWQCTFWHLSPWSEILVSTSVVIMVLTRPTLFFTPPSRASCSSCSPVISSDFLFRPLPLDRSPEYSPALLWQRLSALLSDTLEWNQNLQVSATRADCKAPPSNSLANLSPTRGRRAPSVYAIYLLSPDLGNIALLLAVWEGS